MAKGAARDTDLRSSRKQHNRKKRIRRLVLAAVLILIACLIYISRGWWVPSLQGIFEKPHGLIVNDGKLASGDFPLSLSDNGTTRLYTIDDSFASVDDSAVKFYDVSGKLENTLQHTLAHPAACVSGKKMFIYENGGNSFELITRKGELLKKQLDDTILLAAMKNDVIAVVTSTQKYDAFLTVYDDDGNVIYKWASNKRIVSVDINDDGSGCYISTFTSKDGVVKSVVTELDFDSQSEGISSKELDTLVLSVHKNASGDIWAIGDTMLYTLDNAGNVLSSYDYKGELCAYAANERICAVAYKGVSRKTSELMLFDSDDKEIKGKVDIASGEVKALACDNERVFMLSEHSAECYDINAVLTATAAVSNDYVDFCYLENSLIFIGYREINKIDFKS